MQAIAVQVLGGVFFYFISIYLSKADFGTISWMNAVSIFITTLLSFGLEQVVIRRIAVSRRSDWAAAAFLMHTIAGFAITLFVLLLLKGLIKSTPNIFNLLPWFFAAQGLIYIGTPLKQFLNAREQFTPYGIIALVSNVCKIAVAFILLQTRALYVGTVIVILISTAGFELCSLLLYVLTKTGFSFRFHFKAYTKLIKESFAQYIAVIFDMSLSRMDWILLGVLTSNIVLADYSFAYRAFELAKLPVIVIGPIILPRLARMMALNNKPDAMHQQQINSFNAVEVFFAVLIPLTLNILWVPLVTLITKGKYGDTNALQFLILSVCIPFQFFINLLWSLSFGAKKYRAVTFITIGCAAVNIVLNIILISKFGGAGAAVAFLVTTFLQVCLYYKLVSKHIITISLRPLVLFATAATVIYFMVIRINIYFVFQLLIAMVLYVLFGLVTKQINKQQIDNFKQFLSK